MVRAFWLPTWLSAPFNEGIAELALAVFEIFQGNTASGDWKEVKVAAFGILEKVFGLHAGIEGINETLCSHRQFLGNLRRLDRGWQGFAGVFCSRHRE